jgi:hypothetical protein
VLRNRRKVRRRLLKEVQPQATGAATATAPALVSSGLKAKELVKLESQIDEALALARHLDREALEDIIRLLHSARNRVIVRLEQA